MWWFTYCRQYCVTSEYVTEGSIKMKVCEIWNKTEKTYDEYAINRIQNWNEQIKKLARLTFFSCLKIMCVFAGLI